MPRYHFDLHDGVGLVLDEEGRELPDLAAVRREAVKGIRSVVSAEVGRGSLDLTGRLVVRDGGAAEVLAMTFDEALSIVGSWSPPDGYSTDP
jgi:hypothetical protein